MKTVLMTGGTGYLGSHLLRYLIDKGYKILLIKRSFSNTERISDLLYKITCFDIDVNPVKNIFENNHIDIILHCATDYGRKKTDTSAILAANLLIPLNLLELGADHGVECFINTDTILDKRINEYTMSKKQFKEWLYFYSGKLCCVNLALEHFFGPGDDPTKFVSYIINSMLDNVISIDLTPGEQERDFIYIEDTVSAFASIFENYSKWGIGFFEFEVGTGNPCSIKHFVEMIKELSGNSETVCNFGAIPYRENEVMKCISNNRALKNIGWKNNYSIEEGLERTIQIEKKRRVK